LVGAPGLETSDETLYQNNRATFLAQTSGADGVSGVNGNETFKRGTSKVVGGGLIAMPDENDHTQDLVITRGYLASGDEITRPADPHEVMLQWEVTIG
jgi:hypothetical protein